MRRISCCLLLVLLVSSTPASAAPVAMNAELTVDLQGLASFTVTGSGNVDVSGGSYSVPAGLLSLPGPEVVPVTSTTAVQSLQITGVSNLAGTFAPGGVNGQIPSEVCTSAGPGEACVLGGGLGGVMGLMGLIRVQIIPSIVTFPFELSDIRLGAGGSTNSPFSIDGAPWTTRTALLNTAFNTTDIQVMGSTAAGTISLVSATQVLACGNLFPITATLTLTEIVPEPGALVLIAAGVAGLLGLLRRPAG